MKTLVVSTCLALFSTFTLNAQVGIGNTSPNAMLDISSSNQATPTNTDGILIPKIDDFPASNPTVAQDGMLVYATGSGTPTKGFYYWDNTITNWVSVTGVKRINDLIDGKSDNDGTNNGSSVFLGLNSGSADDSTNNQNVGIGNSSLRLNTTGGFNTAIGYSTLFNNNNGSFNTAVGFSALLNSNGSQNTAIGVNALLNNTGNTNLAVGINALINNTSGFNNVAIGSFALDTNTTGRNNLAVGKDALSLNSIGINNTSIGNGSGSISLGDGNVFLGNSAGALETTSNKLYIDNSNSSTPLIYGEFDNDILRVNGALQVNNPATTGYSLPTTDGNTGQVLQTDGAGSIAFVDAPDVDTEWSKLGNSGTNSGTNFIGTTDTQDLSFRTNNIEKMRLTQKGQLEFLNTGSCVFIGENAGDNDDDTINRNTFVGSSSGMNNTQGEFNSFFGHFSGRLNTTGFSNSFFGQDAGSSNTTGSHNLALGANALRLNNTGSSNVAIGATSLRNGQNVFNNVAVGRGTLFNNISGSSNVAIGFEAGRGSSGSSKSHGVFIGFQAGYSENNSQRLYIANTGTSSPLIYGEFDNNILRVNGTLQVNSPTTTGYSLPTADGIAGQLLQTDGNGVLSFASLKINDLFDGKSDNDGTNDGSSVFLGIGAGQNTDSNDRRNVALGFNALNVNTAGANSAAIGYSALLSNLTGTSNTALGSSALVDNTDGDNNTALGYIALADNTTGNGNTALGRSALRLNTTGNDNTAVGQSALFNSTGNNNTAVGRNALNTLTIGSNNTAIGSNAQVPIVAASNQVRIGNANVTHAALQVPWTITSDSYWKEDIRNLTYGLDIINALKPVDYLRKNSDLDTREVGFIAQDVKGLLQHFGLTDLGMISEDDDGRLGLRYNDFIPILVKAIQEQDEKIKSLEERLEALENN